MIYIKKKSTLMIIIKKNSWAPNHIRMIFERSCDTEDLSNGGLVINYILKSTKTENIYFKL